MERCSIPLVIGEMEVKTTTRYFLMPTRLTLMKEWKRSIGKGMEKLSPSHVADETVKWCSCWGKVRELLKKWDTELPYDPVMARLAMHPRAQKTTRTHKPVQECSRGKKKKRNVHGSSIIRKSQKMEATQMSIKRWVDKQNVVSSYRDRYSAIKRNEVQTEAMNGRTLKTQC